MDAIECLKTRRSIRKYKNKEVSDKLIREVIECACCAPSAMNSQPWEFIVVKKLDLKTKLSSVHKYCGFLKDAPVVIVVCCNKDRLNFSPSSDLLSPAAAIENLLLAAHANGLGACWIYIKDFDEPEIELKVKDILDLPDNQIVISQVSLGWPDQIRGKKKLLDFDRVVHYR